MYFRRSKVNHYRMRNQPKYFTLIITFLLILNFSFAQTGNLDEEFKTKSPETKLTEVIAMDSIKGSELSKRAGIWLKKESLKYKKSTGSSTNGKIDCEITFLVKPKELNPRIDVTSKISMKVVVDC